MELCDVEGAQLTVGWLAHVLSEPGHARGAFIYWAKSAHPDRWRKWAERRGLSEDDEALVLDALTGLQETVLEASRAHLDKLQAVLQVREALGEL
jgi:hypothetical protein